MKESNQKSTLISAKEIAEILQINPSSAYSLIQALNRKLEATGIAIPLRGRTYRRYFMKKTRGMTTYSTDEGGEKE